MAIKYFLICGVVLTCVHGLLVEEGASTDDITHRLQILEQDNALLRQQVFQLTDNVMQLQQQYETLRDKEKNVGFFAILHDDLVNPANGITVPFSEVETNVGDAYDGVHGIFSAPINGTYYFSLVASSPPDSSDHLIHLFIVKNGHNEAYCYLDHNVGSQYEKCTTNALVNLAEGDKVWVQTANVVGTHVLVGHRKVDNADHTHFMGFLVNTAD